MPGFNIKVSCFIHIYGLKFKISLIYNYFIWTRSWIMLNLNHMHSHLALGCYMYHNDNLWSPLFVEQDIKKRYIDWDLYFRIRVLLHRAQKDFEDVCDLRTGVSQCRPSYINMPWTDLIMACVDFKISGIDFTEPDSKVINMDNFNHIS